ncbi:MAG: hypothetical protein RJA78_34 [Actinomycetota bacterium]
MKKIAGYPRFIARFVSWALLASALGVSPASAAPALTLADIYNPAKVIRVDLTLPAASVTSLNDPKTFRTYVPGQVKIVTNTASSPLLDVSVKLKGSTSMSALRATPSFKIKFKKDANGQGYLGLRRMTLNAMTQDTSKIHEFGAYALFNAMNVPAPKTGWAKVSVNGVSKGLYVNVEQPDQIFMAKRFKDITQHIYEGIATKDLKIGNDDGLEQTGAFLVDYGWKVTPNKFDLGELIGVSNETEQAIWFERMNEYFDRDTLITTFAVESFLGHWDGYSGPDINNYYLRSSTRNKFTFIPWGVDQTFGENRQTETLGDTFYYPLLSERADQPWAKNLKRGMLYVKCINYKPCRTQYLLKLKAVSAKATSMKLGDLMTKTAKIIDPTLAIQFKSSPSLLTQIRNEQARSVRFIGVQQSKVKKVLAEAGIK